LAGPKCPLLPSRSVFVDGARSEAPPISQGTVSATAALSDLAGA
jgi:hypothetical protein